MVVSKVVSTTFKFPDLEVSRSSEKVNSVNLSSACNLKWKQGMLWVSQSKLTKSNYLPALDNEQWLKKCLHRSPVRAICLDPTLNEMQLRSWADICQQVGKQIFLRVPSTPGLPQKQSLLYWLLKRITDWVAAVVLLVILSPVLLGIAILIWVSSPGPILFWQWRVGEQGRLFQIIKFRTMVIDAEKLHHQVMANQEGLYRRKRDPRITPIGRWLRRYNLDELPQLINVIRGEMSLVGPRPWALYDAVRISPTLQKRLNALPGITGVWQVKSRSIFSNLEAINRRDLQYLQTWSLRQDFKILLLMISKVLSSFGSC
jgi:lipopolysaccharide/colanic/teichoic acid biosynthesis glycosyltransferase